LALISLNFGLVHQPAQFEYDFDFDDLDDEIKEQLPEGTVEVLQSFSSWLWQNSYRSKLDRRAGVDAPELLCSSLSYAR